MEAGKTKIEAHREKTMPQSQTSSSIEAIFFIINAQCFHIHFHRPVESKRVSVKKASTTSFGETSGRFSLRAFFSAFCDTFFAAIPRKKTGIFAKIASKFSRAVLSQIHFILDIIRTDMIFIIRSFPNQPPYY